MPPSKRNVTLSQLRVGIFVLIAIGVLIFLVLNASGDINPFSRKLHLKARFSDANGLREGSEVRLAGVRVGKVERIILLEPSPVPTAPRVEALLTIDSTIDGQPANQRIRSDSTAQQGSPSLLGNEMLINITPGTANGSPAHASQLEEKGECCVGGRFPAGRFHPCGQHPALPRRQVNQIEGVRRLAVFPDPGAIAMALGSPTRRRLRRAGTGRSLHPSSLQRGRGLSLPIRGDVGI